MDEFLSEIYIEVFKQWILMQSNKNLAISLSDDYKTIAIKNKYSTSQVNFYNMNIVEFSVENLIKKEVDPQRASSSNFPQLSVHLLCLLQNLQKNG